MNTRTLLITGASVLFGLSVAGASFAAVERPDPREPRVVERTVDHRSVDKIDRTDKSHEAAGAADRTGADKSHETADKPEPRSRA